MLHGIYHLGKHRVSCRNAYCTTCQGPRFTEGFRSIVVLHVCFIPFLPIGTTVRWFCSKCTNENDRKRPSQPWILAAGAGFGLLMTAVGVSMVVNHEELPTAIGILLFGPLLTGALIYMIRKQNYQSYAQAKDNVPPLAGDHCPYCKSPLFASVKPHCHSCHVDLITG